MIIQPRASCGNRKAEQQIGKSVARERRLIREGQKAARLNIAESILLQGAKIESEFCEMPAARVADVVEYLKCVGDAFLRIVEFVAEVRKA